MLYLECPSCGWCLGQIIEKYEIDKNKICADPTYTDEEKQDLISKLILSLNLRRYCCKSRVMTYKDKVQDILPVIRN